MPEHFAAPPQWSWWILLYFFFGGITGGAYALGTLLRLRGGPNDVALARTAFYVSFITLLVCPVLLTIDLGRPERFTHMLFGAGINFKYWSPMSVGAWALLIFGIFALFSFLEALEQDGRLQTRVFSSILGGAFGKLFMIAGTIFGLYIAGYTGVLLSVSSEPIWSDTWALGSLFMVSGLSAAAAAVALAARRRADAGVAEEADEKLGRADANFIILELIVLAIFLFTLGGVAGRLIAGIYGILFWVVAVLLGMVVPLATHFRWSRGLSPALVFTLVLIGSFALRAVIIFVPQS